MAGIGNDVSFATGVFGAGVEDLVGDLVAGEDLGKGLGIFNGGGADEDRATVESNACDFVGNGVPFFTGGAEDAIRENLSADAAVGHDFDDREIVDFAKFPFFGGGGAGHSGKFFVEAEEVLVGGAGEGPGGGLDGDFFAGLDGLVETVGPGAAGHTAAGEFVDDDDFINAGLSGGDDVMLFLDEEATGSQRVEDQVLPAFGATAAFRAFGVDAGGDGFAEDFVESLQALLFPFEFSFFRFEFEIVAGTEALCQGVGPFVGPGERAGTGWAGDDEGCAGFINEDGVGFIDEREVELAHDWFVGVPSIEEGEHVDFLVFGAGVEFDLVAEIIEAELFVGAVDDVATVGGAALVVIETGDDDADIEAQGVVEGSHDFSVPFGEVIIDGDDVDPPTGDGVEYGGERGDEGFSFAGGHFGYGAVVKFDPADELDVVGPETEFTFGDDANAGKDGREIFVERFLVGATFPRACGRRA